MKYLLLTIALLIGISLGVDDISIPTDFLTVSTGSRSGLAGNFTETEDKFNASVDTLEQTRVPFSNWTGNLTMSSQKALIMKLDSDTNATERFLVFTGQSDSLFRITEDSTAKIFGTLDVTGTLKALGAFNVTGITTFTDSVDMADNLNVQGVIFVDTINSILTIPDTLRTQNNNFGLGATQSYNFYKDSDVAHGMTSPLDFTDAYGRITAISGTNGGLQIKGASDDAAGFGVAIVGIIGVADPTDTTPATSVQGLKKNGTSTQALGNAETVFQVFNASSALNTVLGNGNFGILDATPTFALDVNGTGRFVSKVTLDDTLTVAAFTNLGDSVDVDNNLNVDGFITTDSIVSDLTLTGVVTVPDTLRTLTNRVGSGSSSGYTSFRDSDVDHGITQRMGTTDTYGLFTADGSTSGGLRIRGASDAAGSTALTLSGFIGVTDPTDNIPAVYIQGGKKDGTNIQALGDDETVFIVYNSSTVMMSVLGNGNVGILDATPSFSLDVNGTGRFVNSLTVDDSIMSSGDTVFINDNLSVQGSFFQDTVSSSGTDSVIINDSARVIGQIKANEYLDIPVIISGSMTDDTVISMENASVLIFRGMDTIATTHTFGITGGRAGKIIDIIVTDSAKVQLQFDKALGDSVFQDAEVAAGAAGSGATTPTHMRLGRRGWARMWFDTSRDYWQILDTKGETYE